jgi:heme/copper-type cytochrome/quinol oxidase subunit 3
MPRLVEVHTNPRRGALHLAPRLSAAHLWRHFSTGLTLVLTLLLAFASQVCRVGHSFYQKKKKKKMVKNETISSFSPIMNSAM